jgi:phenylacetate-CoA ligase
MDIALRYRLVDLIRQTRSISLLSYLRRRQFDSQLVLAEHGRAARNTYFDVLRKTVPLFKDVARFEDLPIIDKRFVNLHRGELVNANYRGKPVRKKTGGSTGEPLVYLTSTETQSFLWAGLFLAWEAAGYRLGDKVAFIAGSSLHGTGFKQRLYYKLLKVTLLSAFDMSPARMEEYATTLADGKFRLLYGYASAIHRLARYLIDNDRKIQTSLRGIVCTAEMLTPPMRADIEHAFGAPCFNQYGCHEAGISAFECEHRKGFHLLSPRAYVEVMPDGSLVSTDLSNDAMFLPRYITGDLVRMSGRHCPCGRGLPLIDEVVGRQNDVVVDSRGAAVHSEFFTHLFREDARIHAFQVTFDENALQVNVHMTQCSSDELESFAAPYRERIARSLHFDRLNFVINQPFVSLSNGKHRFVIRQRDLSKTDLPADQNETMPVSTPN